MAIILFILGILCLLLAAHPFVTYPISLWYLSWLKPLVRGKTQIDAKATRFAICMCAYNEERVIEQKMRNLLALRERHPDVRIHVYVDAATDRTAEILGMYAEDIDLYVSPERHGKTYGMNLLSKRADADVLVFTDANVFLDLDCLRDLSAHFADPSVGCVCGNLTYTNSGASVTASSGSLYWRYEEALKRLETESGSMMGADGSIFAIRRSIRHSPPDDIIDDMYVSLMTIVAGYRLVQARDVHAYEDSATHSGEEFSRKIRIACQAFNVHRLLWPRLKRLDALTRYKYLSHKMLRWLCIYFLIAAMGLITISIAVAGYPLVALALAAACGLALLLGKLSIAPFDRAFDLLGSLAATGIGVWRSARGERFQTWTPAASVRSGAAK